jgi:3-methyladenine DNA glycosylase AlkD
MPPHSTLQTAAAARKALRAYADREKAKVLQGFFKTGLGEYGFGDKFIGVVVPDTRRVAREFAQLSRRELTTLLRSEIHEERLLALIILEQQFSNGDAKTRETIYKYYLRERRSVNNWDLVDASAANIVGAYLFEHGADRAMLYQLAESKKLWDRRIAMVATHYFIRKHDFTDVMRIAELLLKDTEDLMHKATGWMLREAGKRDVVVLKEFLEHHAAHMPRTMLRYAIERFPDTERKHYLARRSAFRQ